MSLQGTSSERTGWHRRGWDDGFAGREKRHVPVEFRNEYLKAYRMGGERRQALKAWSER